MSKDNNIELKITLNDSMEEMLEDVIRSTLEAAVRRATFALVQSEMFEAFKTKADGMASAALQEMLDGEFQPVNKYGEARGEKLTLRELLVDTSKKCLGAKVKKHNGAYTTDGWQSTTLLEYQVGQTQRGIMREALKRAVEDIEKERAERDGPT